MTLDAVAVETYYSQVSGTTGLTPGCGTGFRPFASTYVTIADL